MISLQQQISELVAAAFSTCGYDPTLGEVAFSERPDLSQFQCNGALRGAKLHGVAPRVIAETVATALQADTVHFHNVQVDGPGFINLSLTDSFLAEFSTTYTSSELIPKADKPQKVVVDFGGPNVAKPLHVGHLRSSIIGDSICRLYRQLGHTVYGDIHLGDWGTPMGILITILHQEQPDLPYFDPSFSGPYPSESPVTMEDLERLYPLGSNMFKSDPEFQKAAQQATAELQSGNPAYRALWQHFTDVSEVGLRENFDALGVHFDWWYGESHYHDRVAPLVDRLRASGVAIESNGALVIPLPLTANGSEMPPLILLKSDGAFLYSTTDLACVDERIHDDHVDQIIYVVDQRQHLHFEQVFAAAHVAGLAPASIPLVHAGFGTMNGTDGKPFKTRSGGVMKLKDLIEMVTSKASERMVEAGMSQDYNAEEQTEIAQKVGIAALKFADLINSRISNYIFDLDRFVSFEGKTGPYLIYTAVRIRSIFRRLEIDQSQSFALQHLTDIERPLILMLSRLPEVAALSHDTYSPHVLAEYAFELAQEFNRFYQQTNILHEADEAKKESWIGLCLATLRHLELVLGLLGIEIPERM